MRSLRGSSDILSKLPNLGIDGELVDGWFRTALMVNEGADGLIAVVK